MSSCVRNIRVKNLESDNASSSYSRKCWECFFRHSAVSHAYCLPC